jgi:hypothetical protein
MTELEKKALAEKIGSEAATVVEQTAQQLKSEIELKFSSIIEKSKATEEETKAYKALVEAANEKVEAVLKAQGVEIAALKMQGNKSSGVSLEGFFEKQKDAIKSMISQKQGMKTFVLKAGENGGLIVGEKDMSSENPLQIKAADVHNVTGLDSNVISSSVTGAGLLGGNGAMINTITRSTPFILDYLNVGQTTSRFFPWFDETPKEGAFAIVDECQIKPLVEYNFEFKTANYKKAAGRAIFSEEFERDYPQLVSKIKELMQIDLRNDMSSSLMTDLLAFASPYANLPLNGAIDQADDYMAIGAAVAQLQSLYKKPNLLVISPNDQWIMWSNKSTTGEYIIPPFMNAINPVFDRVIVDPSLAPREFLVGDGAAYSAMMLGGVEIKIGYSTGDWEANKFSIIVEQYFYSFGSTANKTGLIKGNFDVIKSLIEKP